VCAICSNLSNSRRKSSASGTGPFHPLETGPRNYLTLWQVDGIREAVEPESYTTAQAAAMIGISRQALYTWIAERKIDAPEAIKLGRRTMRFWSKAQIKAAKKFKGTQKRGPVPKKK